MALGVVIDTAVAQEVLGVYLERRKGGTGESTIPQGKLAALLTNDPEQAPAILERFIEAFLAKAALLVTSDIESARGAMVAANHLRYQLLQRLTGPSLVSAGECVLCPDWFWRITESACTNGDDAFTQIYGPYLTGPDRTQVMAVLGEHFRVDMSDPDDWTWWRLFHGFYAYSHDHGEDAGIYSLARIWWERAAVLRSRHPEPDELGPPMPLQ
jgi:hypothetical protein